MMPTWAKLLLLLLLAAPAYADTLKGTLVDANGNAVAGALVTVCTTGSTGTPCTPVVTTSQTGSDGSYYITIATGTYDLTFTRAGFTSQKLTNVLTGNPINFTVPGNGVYTGNNIHSGAESFKQINNVVYADQYTGVDACAKIVAAKADVVSRFPAGGVVDATGITGSNTCAATLNLDGSGGASTIPVVFRFSPSATFIGGASANPVVCYGMQTKMTGYYPDETNGTGAAFKTSTPGNTVIQACNQTTQTTKDVMIEGVTLFNTSLSTTAPVVDFTNTSNSALVNTAAFHGGGTGDIFKCGVTNASLYTAFYNVVYNLKANSNDGNLSNKIYDLYDLCNDLKVFGGTNSNGGTVWAINGSTLPNAPNGIHVYGESNEQFANAFMAAGPNAYNVEFYGSRIESSVTGAKIFNNTTSSGSLKGILLVGPDLQGSVSGGLGTDAGGVIVLGYAQGGALYSLVGNKVTSGAGWCWDTNAGGGNIVCLNHNTNDNVTYANNFLPKRYDSSGTAQSNGNIGAFSAGWGTSPSGTLSGTDTAMTFQITAGTGSPTANPTATITFADGTWTTSPVCTVSRQDVSAPIAATWTPQTNATQVILNFIGTPVASTTYIGYLICVGKNRL